MKIWGLLAATLTCSVVWSQEATNVLKSTAESLDNLVSQKRVVYKEINKPGFKPVRKKVPPVSLKRITPIVATQLNIPQDQVNGLLKNDRKKLSEVVLARTLAESSGKTWQALLAEHDQDTLFRLAEERQVTPKVKNTLDSLYTELSFVAFDSFDDTRTVGRPAPSAKGSGQAKVAGTEGSEDSIRKSASTLEPNSSR